MYIYARIACDRKSEALRTPQVEKERERRIGREREWVKTWQKREACTSTSTSPSPSTSHRPIRLRSTEPCKQNLPFPGSLAICWKTTFYLPPPHPPDSLLSTVRPFISSSSSLLHFACVISNGKREDRDKEDRECEQQAGHILQEAEWAAQESSGARSPLWCWHCCHRLLQHREALRVLQFWVRLRKFPLSKSLISVDG